MVGFLPRWISPVVWALIGATLAISLTAAIVARNGIDAYGELALTPKELWAGQVWRLVTWTFVEASPWALISGCIALYWFGGQLAGAWGAQRFAAYVAGIVLFAGAGTAVLALIIPGAWILPHLGGFALSNALVVAWALQFPDRTIPVHVLLQLGGPVLAYGVVLVTVLYAVFYSAAAVLPELLAGCGALLYMNGTAGTIQRRVRTVLVQMRARRLGIRANDGGRHGGPFSPPN